MHTLLFFYSFVLFTNVLFFYIYRVQSTHEPVSKVQSRFGSFAEPFQWYINQFLVALESTVQQKKNPIVILSQMKEFIHRMEDRDKE